MKTIPFDQLPADKQARYGPMIERLRSGNGSSLPPPPPQVAGTPLPDAPPAPREGGRQFRPHFVPSLGETVYVTSADLNDGIFIAEHTPAKDPSNIHGLVLQVMRCVFRQPEHTPANRRFRLDSEQDDRAFIRETLSIEEVVDLAAISSALGRRREYVSEGVRAFLLSVQTCLSELAGHLSTSTDCPPSLKASLSQLTSAASQLTSPTPSASGTASDAAE